MPYISNTQRAHFDFSSLNPPATEGELNYCLTMLCNRYLDSLTGTYQDYNAVIGALECCKLEYYRRMIVPYEDSKCELNGDVYPTNKGEGR